ncbi:MAG TPA: carboxypeptidase regulatory-like domain-containing protein [Bryobacteraceae bacterium]|nr:carboxypeptidase regulatory-like domain-containing protein [Bryobacteraceae bacterium]
MAKSFWRIAALLCSAAVLFGQTASLTGTVTDPQGAVIPGANISIVNAQTGAARDAVADAQGRYTMPQLTPGTYKLSAKATGFADVVIDNVELLVNQPATVPIVFEKVGATKVTVEVSAAATQVNTTDASLGNAIAGTAIVELPFFARNVVNLLQFQPGVTATGTGDKRDGAVNGGRADQSNVTLDGVDVNDQNARAAFTSVLRVTLDSVEEFRTTTTNGAANIGRGSGADVAMVTKSGTNEFHGSLYEYRRGTETAANSFFNNRAGVPIAPLLINVFGGSAGAPIKKNKAFIFFNYEGRRDASSSTTTRTVPAETLKQGIVLYHDKSGVLHQLMPADIKGIDPLGIGVNPAALKELSSFPVGNTSTAGDGLNTTGYLFNSPGYNIQNTYIARLDYKLDNAGKHSLFLRGNLQNDWTDNQSTNAPQFPGQVPNSVTLANNKGLAAGYTAVLTPSMVATTRYGFTRAGGETTGILTSNYEWFRGLDTPYGISTGLARIVPTHTISQDVSWNHSGHDFRFGAIVRLISNQSNSYRHSYSNASSNPNWLKGNGSDISPATLNLAKGDTTSYLYAMAAVLGLEAEGTANYNYKTDGSLYPVGAPVPRDFVNHEGDLYAQDTWRATRELTLTAGLRFSLEPAVYEANGQQVSPTMPFADFMNKRGALADQGLSQQGVGLISFVPANGPGGRPLYPDHNDWSPRVGLAYSPKAEGGLARFLFGGAGKTAIRAGAGMYYDEMGQPLAQTINANAFGLATTLTTPPNVLNSSQVPRYTSFYAVPSAIVPAAGPSGLGAPYPTSGAGSFAITSSLDDQLKAPYTINLNFSVGRDFSHGFFVQGAYVGRLSRHTLSNRDLAAYTDLRDPKSGQTFWQAFHQLATALDYSGVSVANLPKIPFFENMWPGAAGNGFTATQVWAKDYLENEPQGDFSDVLNDFDNAANCSTKGTVFNSDNSVNTAACGVYGPWMMFNPQFSALAAWSSIGKGSYHGLQWTVRKQFGSGLVFDFNYTFSKSIDLGSARESDAGTGNANFAGNSDFIQNAWNPSQMRGVSGYDSTHQVNGYAVYQLPVGRGKQFGAQMSKVVDALIGGWQMSAGYRFTTGFPVSVINGQRWPTNWEVDALGTPNGNPLPPVTDNKNAPAAQSGVKGGPNLWSNPAAAWAAFGETMAGETGSRDTIRGSGIFNIDTLLAKTFTMPWSEHHKFQIRWESFNVTNTIRFDPSSANVTVTSPSVFGQLTGQFGSPRQMQFAGRYTW